MSSHTLPRGRRLLTGTTVAALTAGVLAFAPSTAQAALDPVDAEFATPTITVSKVSFAADETATVTVTGTGFDPAAAANGTRLPLKGQKSGFYVTFGKFASDWRPSAGAASATRKISSQKWALAEPVYRSVIGESWYAPEAALLNEDGSFTTELTISKADGDSTPGLDSSHVNYGVYTFAGSGAVVADYETYTPITFLTAPLKTQGLSTKFGKGGTVKVTAPVTGKVTVAGLGTKDAAAAATVAFNVPKNSTVGTRNLKVSFEPTDTGLTTPDATVTVKITKANVKKPVVKVKKKPTKSKKGKAVVRVKGVKGAQAPNGTVRIKLTKGKKSKFVKVKLSKAGKRTVKLPKLAKGKWTVRAVYLGNANYKKRGYAKVGKIKVTK